MAPSPLFPRELPIQHLSEEACRIAEQLDKSPLVARPDHAARGDGLLSAEKVRAGLAVLDTFREAEQAQRKAMAQLLGISEAQRPAAPRAWLDRNGPPEGLGDAALAARGDPLSMVGGAASRWPLGRVSLRPRHRRGTRRPSAPRARRRHPGDGGENTTMNPHGNVTNIIQHFSNTTSTVINPKKTRVAIHNTEVNNVDVDVLALLESRRQCGFFDPDGDFFLRTRADGKDLVQLSTDESGKHRLIGRAAGDKGPAPRGRQGSLSLFYAESKTLVPFSNDDKGQFAVGLPDAVKGKVYVFAMKDGEPSGAGILEIP